MESVTSGKKSSKGGRDKKIRDILKKAEKKTNQKFGDNCDNCLQVATSVVGESVPQEEKVRDVADAVEANILPTEGEEAIVKDSPAVNEKRKKLKEKTKTKEKDEKRSRSRSTTDTKKKSSSRKKKVDELPPIVDENSSLSGEAAPRRVKKKKGDLWTVHVTWDVLNERSIKYTLRKKAMILSPMSYESPYAMRFVKLDHKDSKLNKKFFKPIIKSFDRNLLYTGQWETANELCKMPGVIFNTSMIDEKRKNELIDEFGKRYEGAPQTDDAKRQVLYGHLVARFLQELYKRLDGEEVRVVFHGVETAPCYLYMDHSRFYDYMSSTYLMHQPVLGAYKPKKPGHAAKKADRMQLRWQYELEYAVLDTIDHLLTTMDADSSITILKRQYRRVPDLYFDRKGKNDVLAVRLAPPQKGKKAKSTTSSSSSGMNRSLSKKRSEAGVAPPEAQPEAEKPADEPEEPADEAEKEEENSGN